LKERRTQQKAPLLQGEGLGCGERKMKSEIKKGEGLG
jgi:hypothetical protein